MTELPCCAIVTEMKVASVGWVHVDSYVTVSVLLI